VVFDDDRELVRFVFNELRSDNRASANIEVKLKAKNDGKTRTYESRCVVAMLSAVGIYGEGSGSRTGNFPLDPCQATAALIARRAGVPLQAVLIEFSSPYLGKVWPLFRPPRLPLRCQVRQGQRLPAEGDVMALTHALENILRSARNPLPAEPR
jgi:1-acyl-sn-glycerol-3-phosphate acyltransferase